jgi:VanZ family protein
MRYFIYYWLPLVLYAGLIFVISSFSLPPAKLEVPFLDKFIHLVEYAILGGLFWRALRTLRTLKPSFLFTIIFSVLYALSDEIHQSFVPGRQFDLWDWAADSLGVILVILYLRRQETGLAARDRKKLVEDR